MVDRLKVIEADHSVTVRWELDDERYKGLLEQHLRDHHVEMKNRIWSAATKRHFLLRQKAKYAGMVQFNLISFQVYFNIHVDGQKIAKKLSKQITKLTSTLKCLITDYNHLGKDIDENTVSVQEVFNLDSTFWSCASAHGSKFSTIPANTTHHIVQSYFLIQRCDEEISMLKEEMRCLLQYYSDKVSIITSAIAHLELEASSSFNKGAIALLNKLKWSCKFLLEKANMTFKMEGPSENTSEIDCTSEIDWTSESSDSDDEF